MQILKRISNDFWWDVARKCSYATFYHTPAWKELVERAFPGRYRDKTFGAILPSGVRVVFPLSSMRWSGPFRMLVSTHEGCYGGFIADGPVSPAEAVKIYKQVNKWKTYAFFMTDNPLGHTIPDEIKPKFNHLQSEDTFMVDLNTDFDTLFSRFQRTQRKDYRRGLKRGVQVRLANSIDEYRAYFDIYRDAVDRWGMDEGYGFNWYPIEQVYHMSQIYPENIKLWVMTVNEQVVGGTIIFYWGTQATAWMGTAHRDFLDYDVMPVGDTEIIRDAMTQGYSYFDFNVADQKQGLVTYKLRFSPTQVPVNLWYYENFVIVWLRKIYGRIHSKATGLFRSQPTSEPTQQNDLPHRRSHEVHS